MSTARILRPITVGLFYRLKKDQWQKKKRKTKNPVLLYSSVNDVLRETTAMKTAEITRCLIFFNMLRNTSIHYKFP